MNVGKQFIYDMQLLHFSKGGDICEKWCYKLNYMITEYIWKDSFSYSQFFSICTQLKKIFKLIHLWYMTTPPKLANIQQVLICCGEMKIVNCSEIYSDAQGINPTLLILIVL